MAELGKRFNEAELRKSYRMGVICTMIARHAGNKNIKPEDFLPKPKQTTEDMIEQARTLTELFGGGE